MDAREIKATLEEREGKKGKYLCIVIKLTPDTEKIVFLDNTEKALINLYYSKNK